jgi:Protein of unknown function (DUF4058)
MKSPFPGMDPYIEDRMIWTDFHNDLAGEFRATLNRTIRPNYFAALTPYVTYEVIEISTSKLHGVRPDIAVLRTGPRTIPMSSTAVMDPPQAESSTELEMPLELMSIEVRQVGTDRLVTAIEILSPVNKQRTHEARIDYLRKRRELLRSQTHFMEIDLLRGGERTPLDPPVAAAPYYVSLSRVDSRPRLDVWTIHLDARLPRIPVPLTDRDPDVIVDLGEVVASVYERGGYDARIDYAQPVPPPALSRSESRMVSRILKKGR